MIRKLLLPAIASLLLAGCATYGYRDGRGDYYYGQPGTEYRYYGGYGGYYGYPSYYESPGYGYGYYGYGVPRWSGSFGHYGYYGPSRHGGRHHGGRHDGHHDGHDSDSRPPRPVERPGRRTPPWRNLDRIAHPPAAGQEPARIRRGVQVAPRAPVPALAPSRVAPVRRGSTTPRMGGWKRDGRRIPAR